MEQLFLRGADLFRSRKRPASQITPNESPRMEQVSTMPRLLDNTQEAYSITIPILIVMIPKTTVAAPIIQETAVREIVTEQDVLPDAEEAEECDDICFELLGIYTNAAILHNWESYIMSFI
jgi:hypothetical protein